MAEYRYRAINPNGRIQRGTLPAHSTHDLHLQLQQAGMVLIESRPAPANDRSFWQSQRKHNLRDMAQLCRQLAQLEQASVPLSETLTEISNGLPAGMLRQGLNHVQRDIQGGASLSQAMALRPRLFHAPMPTLIGAGEMTGRLAQTFSQLATHFDWQQQLRSRLARTLGYPIFALIAMIAVVMFLLTTVIPETSQFLTTLNVKLPAHTRALINIANFVRSWGLSILLTISATIALLMTLRKRSASVAYRLDALVLRLPVIGNFLQQLELARFMQNIAMILDSGIDLLPALGTASHVVRNRAIRESLDIIVRQIEGGLPLSQAMRLSGLFPGLVLRIVRIGEEGGGLGSSFAQIATYYENDVQHAAELMVSALGPIITLLTGGLLIWLVMAVFMPIYDALPQLM